MGHTYGHTTAQLLTDPSVQKSPCSVLSSIAKPKFTEDYSKPKTAFVPCRDLLEPHIPHYSGELSKGARAGSQLPAPSRSRAPVHAGLKPYKNFKVLDLFPDQELDPQRPLEAEDEAPLPAGFMPYPPYTPCPPGRKFESRDLGHPGLRQPQEEFWKQGALAPTASWHHQVRGGARPPGLHGVDPASDWLYTPPALPLEEGPVPRPRAAAGDPGPTAHPQAPPAGPPRPCPAQGHLR